MQNNFIKKNNITLQDEAYWFLANNISEDFLTLESELQKLSIFKRGDMLANIVALKKNIIIIKRNVYTTTYLSFLS